MKLLPSALIFILLTGCHSFGPNGLSGTHPLYNEAISNSINDQFIQNLVRLHYREPTFFLDVANVAATMKLDITGGVGFNSGTEAATPELGSAYTSQPTISYAPLQGENFVKSLLSPLPLESVLALASSGWSARASSGFASSA